MFIIIINTIYKIFTKLHSSKYIFYYNQTRFSYIKKMVVVHNYEELYTFQFYNFF